MRSLSGPAANCAQRVKKNAGFRRKPVPRDSSSVTTLRSAWGTTRVPRIFKIQEFKIGERNEIYLAEMEHFTRCRARRRQRCPGPGTARCSRAEAGSDCPGTERESARQNCKWSEERPTDSRRNRKPGNKRSSHQW